MRIKKLSRLALCTECIAVKTEMVGSNHTRCRLKSCFKSKVLAFRYIEV